MNSSGHVIRVEHEGKEITIIGTAHVSQKSVEDVKRVIGEVCPDAVCVELDRNRLESLVNEKRYRSLDLAQAIRDRQLLYVLASVGLSAYQRKIGQKLGTKPGAELLTAVRCCQELGARLVLADRDIQVTLKRTWANLSLVNKLRIGISIIAAPFAASELTEDQIEALKDRDTVSEMLTELSKLIPGVREPLIDERDQYLASSLAEAPGKRLVAVVGAGHVEGVLAHLKSARVNRASLEQLPRPSRLRRFASWWVPVVPVLSLAWACVQSGSIVLHLLWAWSLPTALGCGLFSALAGAHGLTVLGAIVTAPVATLNPVFGAGSLTALIETRLRRPAPDDCEAIPASLTSLRDCYKNRATRVILVFLLASFGSFLGIAVGTIWVIATLFWN